MMKSGDCAVPLQTTSMVTGPWWPASGPAIVLVTSRELWLGLGTAL